MRKPPSQAEMQKEVDAFNSEIRVGQEVAVTLDDNTVTFDKTKSEAYILSGHTAVVFLEQKGTYLLNRVRALQGVI